jgi:hypothetical protein
VEKRKFIRHPLSYPFEVKVLKGAMSEKERETRVDGKKPARGDGSHDSISGVSDNIGAGGLQFRSGRCMAVGTEVEIDLEVEGRSFRLDGRVVRCERENEGCATAVAFSSPDERLKARMMEQVVRIEMVKNRLERRYGVDLTFGEVAREWIRRYSSRFADRYDI